MDEWKLISTENLEFIFLKCFAGSIGFIGYTSWLTKGLFDEVTGSEDADCEVTEWTTLEGAVHEDADCGIIPLQMRNGCLQQNSCRYWLTFL